MAHFCLISNNPSNYVPNRGDKVWLEFNPQAGHEQAGRRPALVLSTSSFNIASGLALFCPITNTVRGKRFEITIPNGLPVTGVILTHQIKSLDWRARNVVFLCQLPRNKVDEALVKARAILT